MCSRKKVEVKILLISSPNLNFKLHNWNQTDCLHRTWNPDKIPDSTFHHAHQTSVTVLNSICFTYQKFGLVEADYRHAKEKTQSSR